ncbi:N-acetyltransferase family protein [Streptococcus hongkongensis]|nr:phosphinothricin acetyltransferase [Streptococcus uberis]
MALLIRQARLEDTPILLSIYQPYVEQTAITFDYQLPSLEEFRERMLAIQSFYPYLVIEKDGQILGYAYGSAFHEREAYAWSAEVTIYLSQSARGQGWGQKLYQELECLLEQMGVLNLNACIAWIKESSPYLNNGSQAFHQKLGYHVVGHFTNSGYKFDTWFDMIWMEKIIGQHTNHPPKIKSFSELLASKNVIEPWQIQFTESDNN